MSLHYSSPKDEEPVDLELSGYSFDDLWVEDPPASIASATLNVFQPNTDSLGHTSPAATSSRRPPQGQGPTNTRESSNSESRQEKMGVKERYAFKVKSEVEVLDDGFRWRKYGKKMVKNSPNPRNYYKCSMESCPVKKRIERDKDDARYVIATYQGIHNHQTHF